MAKSENTNCLAREPPPAARLAGPVFWSDDRRPFSNADDLHARHVVIRIGVEDSVQFFRLHVKDEHSARVIGPGACGDEPALMVETCKNGTVCRACGEAFRGSGEGKFNDQHACDSTGLGMSRSVLADTLSDWRPLEISILEEGHLGDRHD